MRLVDPLPGEVHQTLEVLLGAENLRLEAGRLTGGGRRLVLGPAAYHGSHRRIDTEAVGVVHIFIAGQTAVDRLPQQGRQSVLGVPPGPRTLQVARRRAG